MPKSFKNLQNWNAWLTHFLGKEILSSEASALESIVKLNPGQYALLLGVPQQYKLLNSITSQKQFLFTPLLHKDLHIQSVETNFTEIPILSGSTDLVLLPHTLDFIDNPRQLISEACRIIRPEGHLIILGFNPYSLWGLKKRLEKNKNMPWSGHFHDIKTIKKWLSLADFELVKQKMLVFRPPFESPNLFKRFKFLEWLGDKLYYPFGSVYMLMVKAKCIPLTPIRTHWKQQLSGLRITPNLTRPSIRKTHETC